MLWVVALWSTLRLVIGAPFEIGDLCGHEQCVPWVQRGSNVARAKFLLSLLGMPSVLQAASPQVWLIFGRFTPLTLATRIASAPHSHRKSPGDGVLGAFTFKSLGREHPISIELGSSQGHASTA